MRNGWNWNEEAGSGAGIGEAAACQGRWTMHLLRTLWQEDAGQDLIEYALVAALVGLGAVAAMKGLKNSIGSCV